MKKDIHIKMILAGWLLLLFYPSYLVAQTEVRMFYFAPTDTITTYFASSSAYIFADSCNSNPTGYSYVLLDSVTAVTFRRIAPSGLKTTYDSLTNTSSVLRREMRKINALSNGLIRRTDILMYDDRTGLPAANRCPCSDVINNLRVVWPCADNVRVSAGEYTGFVFLGEIAASFIINNYPGRYWEWYETILHEFTHTQFAREYVNDISVVQNKWGPRGVSISYGGDNSHWLEELLADQQMPFEEGIASFWALDRNQAGKDSLISFLNNSGYRFYLGSHSFLSGVPEMWNAPHHVQATVPVPDPDASGQRVVQIPFNGGIRRVALVAPHIHTGGVYQLRRYKWLDIPGHFVFYNERMAQGFALMYHEFAFNTRTAAYNRIYEAVRAMTPPNQRLRYPAFFANHLANSMESYARTPDGKKEESDGTLTSSMFVYALYDIITHFEISEADLQREFRINFHTYLPTPKPLAFDNYWAHREAVKQLACPYLGGNNCLPGTGTIDIRRAVEVVRDYFRDSSRILR